MLALGGAGAAGKLGDASKLGELSGAAKVTQTIETIELTKTNKTAVETAWKSHIPIWRSRKVIDNPNGKSYNFHMFGTEADAR